MSVMDRVKLMLRPVILMFVCLASILGAACTEEFSDIETDWESTLRVGC